MMVMQISALLAHLLFLRANGGTQYATALSDTFGTESFIAAALVTQVPEAFIQDIQELYPDDRQIEPGMMLALLSQLEAHSCCRTLQCLRGALMHGAWECGRPKSHAVGLIPTHFQTPKPTIKNAQP